jgi:hypothetical protein
MPTISYTKFDINKLTFTTPVENKAIPKITEYQLMSMPMYEDGDKPSMPTIQGPWMKLDNYGLPSKNDKNGKPRLNRAGFPLSDKERGSLKIPFNLEDPKSKALYDLLISIDQKLENDKEQLFGDKKKAAIYKYQSIVRNPVFNPDAPEDAPEKPDYFVLKLDFDIKTNMIKSEVFLNEDGERTDIKVTSLDDVQKYVRYMCEFRPVFKLAKLFSTKSAQDGKRTYGVGLKLVKIEVKPMVSTKQETETGFVETDDEEEVERKNLVTQVTKVEEKQEEDEEPSKKITRGRKPGKNTTV